MNRRKTVLELLLYLVMLVVGIAFLLMRAHTANLYQEVAIPKATQWIMPRQNIMEE